MAINLITNQEGSVSIVTPSSGNISLVFPSSWFENIPSSYQAALTVNTLNSKLTWADLANRPYMTITNTATSTATYNGVLVVKGGMGVAKNLYAGAVYDNGSRVVTASTLRDYGVSTIAGGTGTAVSTASGDVIVWSVSTLQEITSNGNTTDQTISITNTTGSLDTTTGALVVAGGVGIQGSLYAGPMYSNNSPVITQASLGASTIVTTIVAGTDTAVSTSSGSVTVWNNGTLQTITNRGSATTNAVNITNTTVATNTFSGALKVAGGVGVGGSLYAKGIYDNSYRVFSTATAGTGTAISVSNGNISIWSISTLQSVTDKGAETSNPIYITNVTESNSTDTGALKIEGGVGVGGNLHAAALYDNGYRVLTAGTLGGQGVALVRAGTDTAVNTETGAVTVWNISTLQSVTERGAVTDQIVDITNTTAAVDVLSGALKVAGGVGVSGSIYAGDIYSNGSQVLTSSGGAGYVGSLTAGTGTAISTSSGDVTVWSVDTLQSVTNLGATTNKAISITDSTDASDVSSGALIITGGVGVGGRLFASELYDNGYRVLTAGNISSNGVTAVTAGTDTAVSTSTGAVKVWNNSTLQSVTGRGASTPSAVSITNTTSATSTTTGALKITGGVGVGGTLYAQSIKTPINGTINNANVGHLYLSLMNTTLGYSTLPLQTEAYPGIKNVAIGYDVLNFNVNGSSNVGIGTGVLYENVTGNGNVAIGQDSNHGNYVSSGNYNVSIGHMSSFLGIAGNYNTLIGPYTGGWDNTAPNQDAIYGDRNIYIGDRAGSQTTSTGDYNVIIGSYTGSDLTGNSNVVIADGTGTVVLKSLNGGPVTVTKGIQPRVSSTSTVSSSFAWNSSLYDQYSFTAQATNLTILADSNTTPVEGQRMMFKIITGTYVTAPTVTLTQSGARCFRLIGVTLPPTLTSGNTLYISCIYNSNVLSGYWDVIAVREGPN